MKTSKAFERIQKNIANYLHEPKPERRKHSLFKTHIKLRGHEKSVEDLVFKPNSKDILCSVGVDRQVVVWDLRTGTQPTLRLQEVHKSDINTVDWSPANDNLLATGSNDTLVKILDIRKAYNLVGSSMPKVNEQQNPIIHTLHKHQSKVHVVKFASFNRNYLASCGDSLLFWDLGASSMALDDQW